MRGKKKNLRTAVPLACALRMHVSAHVSPFLFSMVAVPKHDLALLHVCSLPFRLPPLNDRRSDTSATADASWTHPVSGAAFERPAAAPLASTAGLSLDAPRPGGETAAGAKQQAAAAPSADGEGSAAAEHPPGPTRDPVEARKALQAAIAPRTGPGALAKEAGPIQVNDEWEVDPSELNVGERVAVGGFAEVFVGTWRGSQVAIKALLVRDSSQLSVKICIN